MECVSDGAGGGDLRHCRPPFQGMALGFESIAGAERPDRRLIAYVRRLHRQALWLVAGACDGRDQAGGGAFHAGQCRLERTNDL